MRSQAGGGVFSISGYGADDELVVGGVEGV